MINQIIYALISLSIDYLISLSHSSYPRTSVQNPAGSQLLRTVITCVELGLSTTDLTVVVGGTNMGYFLSSKC